MNSRFHKKHDDWHYLNNQFYNKAKTNNILADKLIHHHFFRLKIYQNHEKLSRLYTTFEPLYQDFAKYYKEWRTNMFNALRYRKRVERQTKELSGTLIRQWSVAIEYQCMKHKQLRYADYLPKKRSPFQKGSYLDRTTHLKLLITELAKEPVFKELHEKVLAFYVSYNKNRDIQLGAKHDKKLIGLKLDAAIHAATWQMFRNLGAFMEHFGEDTMPIRNCFDLDTLRTKKGKPKKETELTLEDLDLTEEELEQLKKDEKGEEE